MENDFGKLRKKAFGGFNPKDVVNCIEKTRNELHEYKTQAQKNLDEMKEKIEKLESEKSALEKVVADLSKANSDLQSRNTELQSAAEEYEIYKELEAENEAASTGDSLTVIEINAATNELKKVADDLCNSLREFMDRIAENSISVVVESAENEAEEDFDAEKFMAELEAEIYAKLGVENEAEAEESAEVAAVVCDKVSSILSQTEGFSDKAQKEVAGEKTKSVLDILNNASFIK